MDDSYAGVIVGTGPQTAQGWDVCQRQLREGQAQLLDKHGVEAGNLCARVQKRTCFERRRHRPLCLAQMTSLAGAPSDLHLDQGALRLQVASQDGHSASLPEGDVVVEQRKPLYVERVDLEGRN